MNATPVRLLLKNTAVLIPDDVIEQLVRQSPAGTRFIFQHMGADSDETAARWLVRGRALMNSISK